MNSVIAELLKSAEWSEQELRINAAETNCMEQCYENLKRSITPSQMCSLRKLLRSSYNLQQAENVRFFVNGFRIGLSMKSEN